MIFPSSLQSLIDAAEKDRAVMPGAPATHAVHAIPAVEGGNEIFSADRTRLADEFSDGVFVAVPRAQFAWRKAGFPARAMSDFRNACR